MIEGWTYERPGPVFLLGLNRDGTRRLIFQAPTAADVFRWLAQRKQWRVRRGRVWITERRRL